MKLQGADGRDFLQRTVRPAYEEGDGETTIVDLFAGCGGMALGVAHAAHLHGHAVRIPLAIDNDEEAIGVFRSNFPEAGCVLGDVCDWFAPAFDDPLTNAEQETRSLVGTGIDFLVGGPPCQGNSNLNNYTRRKDPRNALYARMARAARVLGARVVIVENVPTVLHDHGKVVDASIRALEHDGYEVASSVVNLQHVGLPQTRKRHVLLASLDKEFACREILEALQNGSERRERNVGWAIADLQNIFPSSGFDKPSTPRADNVTRMRWLLENGEYDLPNRMRPPCHRNNSHSYKSIYGRLSWDKPAQTVTTGFNSMGQGRNVHPSRPRTITPHEAARLQFLPDFFSFGAVSTRGGWARLIGNAVPPLLTMRIAEYAFDRASTPLR